MKIALFGKAFGSDYDELMIDVLKILKTSSIDIVVYEPFLKDIKHCFENDDDYKIFSNTEEIRGNVDVLFSFGGDGTMLDLRKHGSTIWNAPTAQERWAKNS